MLRDQDFRTVLMITVGYAALALVLLVLQPTEERGRTASAGGTFEVPIAGVGGYFYQIASAE